MFVKCRLREIMADRGLSVQQLARMSGVHRNTITATCGPCSAISFKTLARLCAALKVSPGELLVCFERDLFFSMKQHREVTIHYGSSSSGADGAKRPARGEPGLLSPRLVAARDMTAVNLIVEFLTSLDAGIQFRLQEHPMGRDSGYGANGSDPVAAVFTSGNHIVIGSPIANPWAEPIVAWMFGAEPYSPGALSLFPMGFAWDSRRAVPSSFGWRGAGQEFGVATTRDRRFVAKRTRVASGGTGSDCALIAAKRVARVPRDPQFGKEDARTVVCLLGHGSIGTEGAARVAIDPRFGATLFPSTLDQAEMWAVETQYLRPLAADSFDNCVIKDFALLSH